MFFSRTLLTKMRRWGKNWERKATLKKGKKTKDFIEKIKQD